MAPTEQIFGPQPYPKHNSCEIERDVGCHAVYRLKL